MIVKILGTGCSKCKTLEQNLRDAVEELGIDIDIVKVDSINEIMDMGVMMTPAIAINDVVKSVGKVLSKEKIKKLLQGGE